MASIDADALRAEFVRLMTQDGPTNDARRREFNQAIFMEYNGEQVFSGTQRPWISNTGIFRSWSNIVTEEWDKEHG